MSNKTIEPRTLPGFRDFLPSELRIRKRAAAIISQVLEKYGYEPLETPTLEYQDILLGKYGEDAEKLMYLFKDNGDREVGMRYDLTVPTARILAQYPNLPKPFKRYQVQSVWRADKPQKGRYREFTQFDFDVFGITSPLADAEIIAVIEDALRALNFKNFTIRINSRQVLFQIMEEAGIKKEMYGSAIQSIDKLDKKSQDQIEKELAEKGFSTDSIKSVFSTLKRAQPDQNLAQVIDYLAKFQVSNDHYKFDPTLARGLDYYTGPIFETVVTEPKIGSITGGGRYDKLIGLFSGQDVPAVGTTLGFDRIVDVITELNLWPEVPKSTTRALVTIFSQSLQEKSLEINTLCFQNKVPVEIYLDPEVKLEKQLRYADQKGIPFAVIVGPEEAEKGLVTVKNLLTKEQKTIKADDLIDEIK